MVVTFKVGGVYVDAGNETTYLPFKVTRITGRIIWVRQVDDLVGDGICQQIDLCDTRLGVDSPGVEYVDRAFRSGGVAMLTANKFHCLHPFFPSENSSLAAYLRKDDAGETESIDRFHKKIMKTFVLFFFYFKIIVLARRAKRVVMERMERMYAPGGIGFVAAQESFYRAAKSQRIE